MQETIYSLTMPLAPVHLVSSQHCKKLSPACVFIHHLRSFAYSAIVRVLSQPRTVSRTPEHQQVSMPSLRR